MFKNSFKNFKNIFFWKFNQSNISKNVLKLFLNSLRCSCPVHEQRNKFFELFFKFLQI